MALTEIKTSGIADDAITTDKLANAINTERTANTAKTSLEDNAVTLSKMAGGTDGQIITYDASGDPVAVGPGTDGQVLTSTGAGSPPAFEAIPTPVDATKTTLTGSTNNTITTVTGANAIQGEANLTFDGTDLATTGRIFGGGGDNTHASAGHDDLVLKTTGATGMTIVSGNTSNGTIAFADGTTGNDFYRGFFQYQHDTDLLKFGVGGSTTMEMTNENVNIKDGNLIIGTSGHGIDFSANSHAGGMTSEVLDSYEEGTWTPAVNQGVSNTQQFDAVGNYTKIGNRVHCQFLLQWTGQGDGNRVQFQGLPFTSVSTNALGGGTCVWNNVTGLAETSIQLIAKRDDTIIECWKDGSTNATTSSSFTNKAFYGRLDYMVA